MRNRKALPECSVLFFLGKMKKLGRFGTIWDDLERFETFYVVRLYCIRMRMEVFRILPWIQQEKEQLLISGCSFFMQGKSCTQIVDRLLISPGEKKKCRKNGCIKTGKWMHVMRFLAVLRRLFNSLRLCKGNLRRRENLPYKGRKNDI